VWLDSVDVLTFEDLAHALDDDDFVREEMKANGLKYFKRYALRKGVVAAMEGQALVVAGSLGPDRSLFLLLLLVQQEAITKSPMLLYMV
jgi:hypothetical protein